LSADPEGRAAGIGGRQPLGYYKEGEEAATFRIIDGKRYVVPAIGDDRRISNVKCLGALRVHQYRRREVFPKRSKRSENSRAIYTAVVVVSPMSFGQSIRCG